MPHTGDIIIKEGTIGTKMYFIQEGVVDIVMANGEVSSLCGSRLLPKLVPSAFIKATLAITKSQ